MNTAFLGFLKKKSFFESVGKGLLIFDLVKRRDYLLLVDPAFTNSITC